MTTLNWRRVRDIRLTGKLIPHPNNTSSMLDHLAEVRVAFDGAFVHIDPRDLREQHAADGEVDIYVVPAASVKVINYKVPDNSAEAHIAALKRRMDAR